MDSNLLFYSVVVMWFVFGVIGMRAEDVVRSLHCVYGKNPVRFVIYMLLGVLGGPFAFLTLYFCIFIDDHFVAKFFPIKK